MACTCVRKRQMHRYRRILSACGPNLGQSHCKELGKVRFTGPRDVQQVCWLGPRRAEGVFRSASSLRRASLRSWRRNWRLGWFDYGNGARYDQPCPDPGHVWSVSKEWHPRPTFRIGRRPTQAPPECRMCPPASEVARFDTPGRRERSLDAASRFGHGCSLAAPTAFHASRCTLVHHLESED